MPKWSTCPFRGNAPALTEVMAGRVAFMFYPMVGIAGHVENKRMRVSWPSAHPNRCPSSQACPPWTPPAFPALSKPPRGSACWPPPGTPQPVVDKLNASIQKAMAKPEVTKRMKELGAQPCRRYAGRVSSVLWLTTPTRWDRVIKASGITAQ